jgi:hypothetical protein
LVWSEKLLGDGERKTMIDFSTSSISLAMPGNVWVALTRWEQQLRPQLLFLTSACSQYLRVRSLDVR